MIVMMNQKINPTTLTSVKDENDYGFGPDILIEHCRSSRLSCGYFSMIPVSSNGFYAESIVGSPPLNGF